jgi:hypothetical protein
LYFALSAVLLTLIQQPFNLSFFAWVAFVPFVIGALSNVGQTCVSALGEHIGSPLQTGTSSFPHTLSGLSIGLGIYIGCFQ